MEQVDLPHARHSRVATKDCSPWREPWDFNQERNITPAGATERDPLSQLAVRTLFLHKDLRSVMAAMFVAEETTCLLSASPT